MRQLLKHDDGAVAVTVALFLIVFVGLAAMVVDAGYMYSVRRQLQAAADAGALAGCQKVILGEPEDTVLQVAQTYVQGQGSDPYNAVKPADGVVMVLTAPDTEVTADHVKVTVYKDTGLFFGAALGLPTRQIRAQAIAKVAYLTGLKGIVPWAVPTINANRVSVQLSGGSEVFLSKDPSGAWAGSIPVGTASAGNRTLRITAYNGQTAYPDGTPNGFPDGVPEVLNNAGGVSVEASGGLVQAVSLDKYCVTTGEESYVHLYVEATSTPTARFANRNYTMSLAGGNTYVCSLAVPSIDTLHESFPIDVSVGQGSGRQTLNSAAVLVVRRSTFPVSDISLSPVLFQQNSGTHYVNVSVRLIEYEYGQTYTLKVIGGGAEIGNFAALDLGTIKHPPNWRNPQDASEYDVTMSYYDCIAQRFPYAIHLGDTVWTQTGNMSGPQSQNALEERIPSSDNRTFSEWEAAGKPPSSRVVYVPVVEKMQPVTGQTPVRVISLAAFYLEPGTNISHDIIRGRFIEFVAPADAISDTPPAGMYIKTVHLVPTSY